MINVSTSAVHVGDCRKLLKQLPDGYIQTCVTSPPYWGLRDYGHDEQIGLEQSPAEYVAQMVAVFREVRRVLADDGTLWLNLGDSYSNIGKTGGSSSGKHARGLHGDHQTSSRASGGKIAGLKPKDLVGIPWMVAFALREEGWYLRSEIIWHKPNPMPESVTDRPTKSHEHLFLLSKSASYFYDADAIAEQAITVGDNRGARTDKAVRENAGGSRADSAKPQGDTRNRRDVWTIATQPYDGAHFATMPPDLVTPCVLAGSRTGDVVLDPFFGSGTVGMVAEKCGRRWIGFELNPEYVALANGRTAQKGLAL